MLRRVINIDYESGQRRESSGEKRDFQELLRFRHFNSALNFTKC